MDLSDSTYLTNAIKLQEYSIPEFKIISNNIVLIIFGTLGD